MEGRGRGRVPEIGRGQGERRDGPDRTDLRSRRLRRGLSAEGFSTWRAKLDLRLRRRRSAPAGQYRQPAALADLAAATARLSAAATLSSADLSAALDLSGKRGRPASLWRGLERADLATAARRRAR